MEIQREFTSRDRLVAAMAQFVIPSRRHGRSGSESPSDTLARLARQEWAAYRAHPWLATVLASTRPPLAPGVLDLARGYVDAFIELGADPPTALGRYLALSAYIQGMAALLVSDLQESTRPTKSPAAWWSDEVRRLDRTRSRAYGRWIAEVSGGHVSDAADVDRWFADGLESVLAGLVGELR